MEGAESRLRLFQMDLLHYDSIVAAVGGAAGIFHLASPCIVDEVRDPEVNVLTRFTDFSSAIFVYTLDFSASCWTRRLRALLMY